MSDTNKLVLSIDEAAVEANSCRDRIYHFIKRRELRAVKMGRRTVVLRADLEVFLSKLPKLDLPPPNATKGTRKLAATRAEKKPRAKKTGADLTGGLPIENHPAVDPPTAFINIADAARS